MYVNIAIMISEDSSLDICYQVIKLHMWHGYLICGCSPFGGHVESL